MLGTSQRPTLAAKAMDLDTRAPEEPSRVVIIPNLQASAKDESSSIFSLMEASSLFLAL